MNRNTILIVNDEKTIRQFLRRFFISENFEVGQADNDLEAIEKVKKQNWNVVILDLNLPEERGLEVLRKIKQISPKSQVIIMTGYASVSTAVEAMKLGAYDYIVKPFENDDLLRIVNSALRAKEISPKTEKLAPEKQQLSTESPGIENIIGRSRAMREIMKTVTKVAKHDTTVLITGESGTGKNLIARAIHNLSNRRNFPFVTINCAVLPETLLESELFGHEKGAFTGAVAAKEGKFELANKGTVFLDEIGTLSFQTQAKLLRVLQDKTFERLGGKKTITCDVRIIAATNEDLKEAIAAHRFRKDLFYRLDVVGIRMPSLRERKEDIPDLAMYFITQFNKKFNLNVKGLSEDALKIIMQYPWPGNVRELENVIERAIVLGNSDIITPDELPKHMLEEIAPTYSPTYSEEKKTHLDDKKTEVQKLPNAITDIEKKLLLDALQQTGGHRQKTANLLGISRRTLQYKLKKYNLLDLD